MRVGKMSFPHALKVLRGWKPTQRAVEAVLRDVEGPRHYAAHYEEALQLVCRAFLERKEEASDA